MTLTSTEVRAVPLAVDLYGNGRIGGALRARLDALGIPCASVHTRQGTIERRLLHARRHVLVDATPPSYAGTLADAWVRHLEEALREGQSVITCNKAPLAIAWRSLHNAASVGGASLACAATVGGGTPVLSLVSWLARTHELQSIEATLSGTLSFLLAGMGAGVSLDEGLERARNAGLAEPDPRLDLDGTDAYAKAIIVHNLVFDESPPIALRDREDVLSLNESEVKRLYRLGLIPQVVARIARGRISLKLEGSPPGAWPPLRPGDIAVRAHTASGGTFTLTGQGAGVEATAGVLAAEVVESGRTSSSPRGGIRP